MEDNESTDSATSVEDEMQAMEKAVTEPLDKNKLSETVREDTKLLINLKRPCVNSTFARHTFVKRKNENEIQAIRKTHDTDRTKQQMPGNLTHDRLAPIKRPSRERTEKEKEAQWKLSNKGRRTKVQNLHHIAMFVCSDLFPQKINTTCFTQKSRPNTDILRMLGCLNKNTLEDGKSTLNTFLNFADYTSEIMQFLNVADTRVKNAFDTKKGLLLLNFWLNSGENEQFKSDFSRHFYRLCTRTRPLSPNETYKNILSYGLQKPFDETYAVQNTNLPVKSLNAEIILEPLFASSHDPVFDKALKECKQEANKLLKTEESTPMREIEFSFYELICGNIIYNPKESKRLLNPFMKNLLFFYPEFILFVDWRLRLQNYTLGKEQFVIESSYILNILGHYNTCCKYNQDSQNIHDHDIKALEAEIKALRIHIKTYYTNNFNNDAKKKLYEKAMLLRYDSGDDVLKIKKANALFTIMFANVHNHLVVKEAYELEKKYINIMSLQIVIGYYSYIGIHVGSRLKVFPFLNVTIVCSVFNDYAYIELLNTVNPYVLLYDELINGLI